MFTEKQIQLFKTLSLATRTNILDALGDKELSVTDLINITGLEQTRLSQQLMILKRERLVLMRPDGKRRLYKANKELLKKYGVVYNEN